MITIIKTTNLRNGSEVLLTGRSLCLRDPSVVAAYQVQAFAILKKNHHVTGDTSGGCVVVKTILMITQDTSDLEDIKVITSPSGKRSKLYP